MNKYQLIPWRWQLRIELNVEKLTYKKKFWNTLDQLWVEIAFKLIEDAINSCSDEYYAALCKLRRRSND